MLLLVLNFSIPSKSFYQSKQDICHPNKLPHLMLCSHWMKPISWFYRRIFIATLKFYFFLLCLALLCGGLMVILEITSSILRPFMFWVDIVGKNSSSKFKVLGRAHIFSTSVPLGQKWFIKGRGIIFLLDRPRPKSGKARRSSCLAELPDFRTRPMSGSGMAGDSPQLIPDTRQVKQLANSLFCFT